MREDLDYIYTGRRRRRLWVLPRSLKPLAVITETSSCLRGGNSLAERALGKCNASRTFGVCRDFAGICTLGTWSHSLLCLYKLILLRADWIFKICLMFFNSGHICAPADFRVHLSSFITHFFNFGRGLRYRKLHLLRWNRDSIFILHRGLRYTHMFAVTRAGQAISND